MPDDTTTPCRWYLDNSDDFWVAACQGAHGYLWVFDDGGPVENHMEFCGYCGKRIEIVAAPDVPIDAVELVD